MNELIIIIILILINGLLAMSEIALISVRRTHLLNEIKRGNKSAKLVLKIIDEPDKFLSTIQIGITIIGIMTGIYSGSVLVDDFSEILVATGLLSTSIAHPIAQSIIIVVVTYFTLIFGELVPKRLGMSSAEKMAMVVARPMYLLSKIASPFVWLLAKSTALAVKLSGIKADSNKVTEEEIKSMIQEGAKDGEIQEVEQDIVERVFLLGDLKVGSLMTHRSEIVALDINMSNAEIKDTLKKNLYEMYPIIDRNLDNVRGVVSLRELVFKLEDESFDLQDIMAPAIYFPENMSVYKVLEQIKNKRLNHALICDEFGSCQGIITLKDILVGLVGALDDVHSEPDIIKRTDGDGWLVDGQCPLYDFLSYFDKEHLYSNGNDFHTIGGLVFNQLEYIPNSGEKLEWKEFKFEIVDMDGARIDKILVTID